MRKMKMHTKKTVTAAAGWLAFLAVLGIVGGMEWGDIPTLRGGALAAACELIGAAAWWKAGVIRR